MQDVIVLPRSAAKQPEPYNGHDIILTEKFQFAVVFEDEHYPIYCASLQEAHDKIDAYRKRKAKQNKAKETCKLHYASLEGDAFKVKTGTVKGFHASQGHVLTDDGTMPSGWYPDTPLVRDYLTRLGALRREARDIEKVVNGFRLSGKPVYGRTSAERYDEELAKIVKEYERKRQMAEDMAKSLLATA
jgi:hypothetical protein